MHDRVETEIRVFLHFAQLAQIPVIPESVEKRHPPEPDILCSLTYGERLAFELVEVCNPRNVRFAASAYAIRRSITSAVEQMSAREKAAFTKLFTNRPLNFRFWPEASLNQIRNVLPSLLRELLSMPEVQGEFLAFSPPVRKVVDKVRLRGRLNDPDCLNFNLGGDFDPGVPLEPIVAKLKKTYTTPHPIELLAHFGAWALPNSATYREPLSESFRTTGTGQFRRIWVLEWEKVGLVYPENL